MAYQKQNFIDGKVLFAEQLNHIEDGIVELEESIATPPASVGEVTLLANKWVANGNLYSQVVSVSGVTDHSRVDLTPSVEQLAEFYTKNLAFVTENDGGVVTVYAIGEKPENDHTIQVTILEVKV